MNDTILRVSGVSKRYVIGHKQQQEGLRHRIEAAIRSPRAWFRQLSDARKDRDAFWALDNVSFEIKRGDVVGIIGRNGAGKSTLLRILSRITEPTKGRIEIAGRVASLLEVGTGFHPELTGRENIFLNGAILGMSRLEIRRKFDEIVAFSETERFLDTPVKRYSSGMYVRLAFAVAAHLEPEILVVDEVLAVGDAQFQKKCLGKMSEASQGGRTVLFVSHNMAAVTQLTTSCILLRGGKVQHIGPTVECVDQYLSLAGVDAATSFDVSKSPRQVLGNQHARFECLRFDRASPHFTPDEPLQYIARIKACEDIALLRFSMTVYAADGTPVGSCFGNQGSGLKSGQTTEFTITLRNHHLAPGRYFCGVAIGKGTNRTGHIDYDIVLETLHFEIRPEEGDGGTIANWNKGWGAVIFPPLEHSIRYSPSNSAEVFPYHSPNILHSAPTP